MQAQGYILFSTSAKLRQAFHILPIETTPAVKTEDWFRFWRIDVKKYKDLGEVMLFTNHETLYTFIADSADFKSIPDILQYFMPRYAQKFHGHFGYDGRITEQLMFHKASDRSVIGTMNSHFYSIEYARRFATKKETLEALEKHLNRLIVLARKIVPCDYFQQKLEEGVNKNLPRLEQRQ